MQNLNLLAVCMYVCMYICKNESSLNILHAIFNHSYTYICLLICFIVFKIENTVEEVWWPHHGLKLLLKNLF